MTARQFKLTATAYAAGFMPFRPENKPITAAAGPLSLEKAANKWNEKAFLDNIFAMVLVNDQGEKAIFQKGNADIKFIFVKPKMVAVLDGNHANPYEVKAIFCKDRSGVEITGQSIRFMNGAAIAAYSSGLPRLLVMAIPAVSIKKLDNRKLLELMAKGDSAAFCTYIDRHRKKYIGQNKGIPSELLEDALQDLQLKYINEVQTGRWTEQSPEAVLKWIKITFSNLQMDIFRRKSRWDKILESDTVVVDDEEINISEIVPDFTNEPIMRIGQKQFIQSWAHWFDQAKFLLPPKAIKTPRYVTLTAAFFEAKFDAINEGKPPIGLTEFAQENGITKPTMQTHIKRALELFVRHGLDIDRLREGLPPELRCISPCDLSCEIR